VSTFQRVTATTKRFRYAVDQGHTGRFVAVRYPNVRFPQSGRTLGFFESPLAARRECEADNKRFTKSLLVWRM